MGFSPKLLAFFLFLCYYLQDNTKMKTKESIIHSFFLLSGIFVIIIPFGIFLMLLLNGLRAFQDISISSFFLRFSWNPSAYERPSYGILSMVISSFMVTLGAMIIAVPLGVGSACYISELAPSKVREVLKPTIEILAGVPSVVIGFLGIVLVGPVIAKIFNLPNGLNALNGSILLAVMVLPTIVSISEDAIRAVPKEFKEASFALGASRMGNSCSGDHTYCHLRNHSCNLTWNW